MTRSERYREYERSYSRRVYRERRDCGHSRRGGHDSWDSDGPEFYDPPRDPRPGHGHVKIAPREAPPPPPPPLPSPPSPPRHVPYHCHPQVTTPCHCGESCANREALVCYYPAVPASGCCTVARPAQPLPAPEPFAMTVVDCSKGQNCIRNGESYTILISADAIVDDIISLLAPDRYSQKVIVRWKEGSSERLHHDISMDELKRNCKHLVVEARK